MSGPKVFTEFVIHYLPTLREVPSLAIRCKPFERHQSFKVASADDRSPRPSSSGIVLWRLRSHINQQSQVTNFKKDSAYGNGIFSVG